MAILGVSRSGRKRICSPATRRPADPDGQGHGGRPRGDVTITIDGQEIEVKKAVPCHRRAREDPHRTSKVAMIPRRPRSTTRRQQLYREKLEPAQPDPDSLPPRIHGPGRRLPRLRGPGRQVLEANRAGRGRRKLLPACQHRVEDAMIVDTVESPDAKAKARVHAAVKVLTELLMTDHPTPVRQGAAERRATASWRHWPDGFGCDRSRDSSAGRRAPQGRLVAGHRRRPQRLHPLRPLRAGLRRDQGEPRHRPHGQRVHCADRLRPRCRPWAARHAWPAASASTTARPAR